MAGLSSIAAELLLGIFQRLDNVDDALHLAQSSKRIYAVFDTHRFLIMKTISLSSGYHEHDIMLCHFQDAFQRFSSEYLCSPADSPSIDHRPPSACFEQCMQADSLSDQQVWDIVARWQGLRPLQHLYFNPAIRSRYTQSQTLAEEADIPDIEMVNILKLARNGKGIKDENGKISPTTAFSVPETGRLYKAPTAYWVASESRKLAQQCRYQLQSTQFKIYKKLVIIWHRGVDLQEDLDILELFDFVYGFLCLHIDGADFGSFPCWVEEGWSELGDQDVRGQWCFFIMNMWLALTPADVLELLNITSLWQKRESSHAEIWTREKRVDYLRMRGCFSFGSSVVVSDVNASPEKWCSALDLEWRCELQLQKIVKDRPSEVARVWEKFRTTRRQTDVRGQFGQMTCTKLLEFMTLERYGYSQ